MFLGGQEGFSGEPESISPVCSLGQKQGAFTEEDYLRLVSSCPFLFQL